jgi:molecular chaperone GrpE
LSSLGEWQYFCVAPAHFMKIKNPFTKRKVMSQDPEKSNELQDPIAEEIQRSSEAEASEQKPLEEDPTARLEAEVAELKDNHLRLYAEFENYKRRSIKERAELIRTAGADTISALLPVLDDLDRALKAIGDSTDNPMKEGILLIHNKLKSTLEQKGLKAIEAIGKEFDVELHEAITNMPVEDPTKKGKVIDEVEKGYWLNDKVIRYSKVVIGS